MAFIMDAIKMALLVHYVFKTYNQLSMELKLYMLKETIILKLICLQ